MRPIAFLILLLLISTALAQGGFPGGPQTPIEELSITPQQTDIIEMTPGERASLSFTLANEGEEELQLTILGGGPGGRGPGGVGGRQPGNGSEGPGGRQPPPDGGSGSFQPRARVVNATLLGEPNLTLAPGGSQTVTYEIVVSYNAPAGDNPVNILVRLAASNRTSSHVTMVRVSVPDEAIDAGPPSDDEPAAAGNLAATPWPSLALLIGILAGLAWARPPRRRDGIYPRPQVSSGHE